MSIPLKSIITGTELFETNSSKSLGPSLNTFGDLLEINLFDICCPITVVFGERVFFRHAKESIFLLFLQNFSEHTCQKDRKVQHIWQFADYDLHNENAGNSGKGGSAVKVIQDSVDQSFNNSTFHPYANINMGFNNAKSEIFFWIFFFCYFFFFLTK